MSVKNLVLIFCVVICATASRNFSQPQEYCIYSHEPLPNYYWRKYEGEIPHDAVPGGHTSSGKITYIAQVLITNHAKHALLPGTIQIGQTIAEVPFYGVHKSKNYIAILCSDTPSALKWRLVNEYELPLVNDYLVVGGYEDIQTAYIGRASHSNHLIVGKVFLHKDKGLRIVSPDKKEEFRTVFEVLVFDPTD